MRLIKNLAVFIFLLLSATKSFPSDFKNVIFSSKKEEIILNGDSLKKATHVILFHTYPCLTDYTKLCGNTFSENHNDNHSWGSASIDEESISAIRELQAYGVKVLIDMAPTQDFYDAISKKPSIYYGLSKSISDFIEFYQLDGFDYDFEPAHINNTNPEHLKGFIRGLRQLMQNKLISITPQKYTLNSGKYVNLYDKNTNQLFIDDLDFINVQYYDVGEEALRIDQIVSWYTSMVTGESPRIPSDKLVLGFALGVNDTNDKWAYKPSLIANEIIIPMLTKKGFEFGGVMAWRFLNNKFYDENWLSITSNLFASARVNLL